MMWRGWNELLLAAHLLPAFLLLAYSLNLYALIFLWLRRRRQAARETEQLYARFAADPSAADWPPVTTQLPLFNEIAVAERALRAAAAMRYPAGRHTIQALDDSTDGTRAVVDRVAAELRAAGHDVRVLRRPARVGFKAGALAYGMAQSDADLFAVFDADFVPPPDFLLRAVPILRVRPELGMVQARWGHLNAEYSPITRAEALAIDGHFTIDQGARAWGGFFMNFNGAAGLWRRPAIIAAGGWQHDTLTEDLDLSYRAQLAGWPCFYLHDLVVPAELPENINAFKTQQFRWAKGSIQTARKVFPLVWRSNRPVHVKLQALLHLTAYAAHPLMLWLALLSFPLVGFTSYRSSSLLMNGLAILFTFGAVAPYVLYALPQFLLYRDPWRRVAYLPLLMLLGVGIAVSNTRAVWEAITGRISEFVRTPKRGAGPSVAYRGGLSRMLLLETLCGIYCLGALCYLATHDRLAAGAFIFIYAAGFILVGALSFWHALFDGSLLRRTPG